MKSVFPIPLYLGAATRTPIAKFGGSLKRFSAPQLGAIALREALKRAPDAATPDFVFMGHARQAGCGPNPARQVLMGAGLPETIPAVTYNQACASGMASIIGAVEKIALGRAQSVWAGGVESMSNTPYFLMQARWGSRMGHGEVTDGMQKDGFFCPLAQMLMGETVERYLAQELSISRREQDEYALSSQKRADIAWSKGLFTAETFEIKAEGKYPAFNHDEHRRPDTSIESLEKLIPVFDAKNGSVTAGNSSGITDGAAWVHVSPEKSAHTQAEIIDYEITALDPRRMGLGPIESVEKLLRRQGLKVSDIEAFEVNEAFAAQVIACQRALGINPEKLNARGGSIALGHPIGATGTRITVTLLHQLSGKTGALGVASLCVSGGMGVSLLVKTL